MGSTNIFLVVLGLLFGVLLIIALIDTIRRRKGSSGYMADEPRLKTVDDEEIVVERRYEQDTGEVTFLKQKEETGTGDVITEERTYAADTGELIGVRVVEQEIEADGDVRIIEQTYDPETGAVTVLDHTRDSETGEVTEGKLEEHDYDEETGELKIVEHTPGEDSGDVTVVERLYDAETGELTDVNILEQDYEPETGDLTITEEKYDLETGELSVTEQDFGPDAGDTTVVEHTYDAATGELTGVNVLDQDYEPESGDLTITEQNYDPETGELIVIQEKYEPVVEELVIIEEGPEFIAEVSGVEESESPDLSLVDRGQASVPVSDDLKVIEGIGPKMASILKAAGIQTFHDLANTSVEKLDDILSEAGMITGRSKTWPDQARLAAEGDWEGLKNMQDNLKGGL